MTFLLFVITVIWTQQQQQQQHQQEYHRRQPYILVAAFSVVVNHQRSATRKPSLGMLAAIPQQYQRQEIVALWGKRGSNKVRNVLAGRRHQTICKTWTTQLAMNQQEDQADDESSLFYNDFDGFKSDDIYMSDAKDRTKAIDNGMEVDDNNNEKDSIVSDDALGDWRSFRRKLASQDRQQKMPSTSTSTASSTYTMSDNSNKTVDGLGGWNNNNSIFSSTTTAGDSFEQGEEYPQESSLRSSSFDKKESTTTTRKKTRSPNELLFEKQNDKLAQEYYQDSWAHEIATV